MTYVQTMRERPKTSNSIPVFFQSFPIACFTLTAITDLAYIQTLNLLWLHFSEWLLLAGLVFGGVGLIVRLFDMVFRKVRPAWSAVLGGVIVLVLAILNSFVHTADGWTAVVPYGLTLSIVTVVTMLVTAWLAGRTVYNV